MESFELDFRTPPAVNGHHHSPPVGLSSLACPSSMASSFSQTPSSSSLSLPCKWGYCLERFEDPHALGAHVRAHVRAERMVPVDELEVETRDGLWYAREKQSQGFGTFLEQQAGPSTSLSQPSTTTSATPSQPQVQQPPSSQPTDDSLTQSFHYQPPPIPHIDNPIPQPIPAINPPGADPTVVLGPTLAPTPPRASTSLFSAPVVAPQAATYPASSPIRAASPSTHLSSQTRSSPPAAKRRTSGGFGNLPLGKKSVLGFSGGAHRFGFGSSPSGPTITAPATAAAPAATDSSPTNGHPDLPPAGSGRVLVPASQSSPAAAGPLPSTPASSSLPPSHPSQQLSPSTTSSLGAQTQLDIQDFMKRQQSANASAAQSPAPGAGPPSPAQRSSSPPSSPRSFIGQQTQREMNGRRNGGTPFPSSPPTGHAGGGWEESPSPTSRHLQLMDDLDAANHLESGSDGEDEEGDEMMSEFLDFESGGDAAGTTEGAVGDDGEEEEDVLKGAREQIERARRILDQEQAEADGEAAMEGVETQAPPAKVNGNGIASIFDVDDDDLFL